MWGAHASWSEEEKLDKNEKLETVDEAQSVLAAQTRSGMDADVVEPVKGAHVDFSADLDAI